MKTFDEMVDEGVTLATALTLNKALTNKELACFMSGFDKAIGLIFGMESEAVGDIIRERFKNANTTRN